MLALAAIAMVVFSASAFADAPPPMDIARALKIATDYLAQSGRNAPYIESISLEKEALLAGKQFWVARWSRPIVADGYRETGLRVNFDGTTARLARKR